MISLNSLTNRLNRGRLSVNHDYQRSLVWTLPQKQLLIDSIINDIDIPKFYFHVISDGAFQIVDGQQRTFAIRDFMEGEFRTADETEFDGQKLGNKTFGELPIEVQDRFGDYNITTVELYEHSEDDVKDIFVRHQEGAPLNAAEKRRALPGNMPSIVKQISETKIFSAGVHLRFDDKRFGYQDVAAQIFHEFQQNRISIISAVAIKKMFLSNQSLKETDSIVKETIAVLNFIHKAFNNRTVKLSKVELRRLALIVKELLQSYNLRNFQSQFADAFLSFEVHRNLDNQKSYDKQDPNLIEYRSALRNDSIPSQQHIEKQLKDLF